MTTARRLFASALGLMLALLAAPLSAQLCAGLPMGKGQTAVGLTAGFPENATSVGVDGRYKPTDDALIGLSYSLTSIDDDAGDDIPSQHTFGVRAGYSFTAPLAVEGPQLGICPNAGVRYTDWEEINVYAIPLGVGCGTAVDLGDGSTRLSPYVNPSLVFSKLDADGAESDWENDVGITAGANLIVTNLFFGALFTKVGDADGVFGLQGGLVF